jgi:hypothetical protein
MSLEPACFQGAHIHLYGVVNNARFLNATILISAANKYAVYRG